MAWYRLKSVSLNLERDGKREYHKVGSTVELTKKEAKTWAFGIEPAMAPAQSGSRPTGETTTDGTKSFLEGGEGDVDQDSEILSENVPEVVEYLSEHKNDLDLLVALRESELKGKRRKKVLDTINDLLTEGGYEGD